MGEQWRIGCAEVKDRHARGKNAHAYSVVADAMASMMGAAPTKGNTS
jgi:hypothetical protein